jgi:hypothetical protein
MAPAIVVVAYDRDHSLSRLLTSVSNASFDSPADLIISIDKNDNQEVYDVAHAFNWEHGEKRVLEKNAHLGLKQHILQCGDLVEQYGSVILLEDDLFVSPYFYTYAQRCFEFYEEDDRIAGISLYSHRYNETAYMAFRPIDDNSDVFFLQIPSSWGQGWTQKQWSDFRVWFEKKQHIALNEADNIPFNVMQWPDSSWKKYFLAYMIESNKFFAYPRISLSTNFEDPGTHHKTKQTRLQVPLQFLEKCWKFKPFEESYAVYDAYLEILPGKLKRLSKSLKQYDFEVDFYAQKNLKNIKKKYILTSRDATDPILTYGKELKPVELNVVCDIEGSMIHLTKTENCNDTQNEIADHDVSYYYNIPTYFINHEEQLRNKESYYQKELEAVYNTKSWKLTVPLRWVNKQIRKLASKETNQKN